MRCVQQQFGWTVDSGRGTLLILISYFEGRVAGEQSASLFDHGYTMLVEQGRSLHACAQILPELFSVFKWEMFEDWTSKALDGVDQLSFG